MNNGNIPIIVTTTQYQVNNGISSSDCNMFTHPINCPLIIYIIFFIISIIIVWIGIIHITGRDRNGKFITSRLKLWAGLAATGAMIIIGLIYGIWLIYYCKRCHLTHTWMVFIITLLTPIFLVILGGVIAGSILQIGFIFDSDGITPDINEMLLSRGTNSF